MSSEKNIAQLTDHLFRHEAGKMVAVLTRLFGLHNIEMAEDVVQDAFAKALKHWIYKLPDNPAGWLMQTAKNKAIDMIRKQRYEREFANDVAPLLKSEYTTVPTVNRLFLDHEIQDSRLRMIFACCHPKLSEHDQIALTLKTCSGFSVQEIANALLSNQETIRKRLHRAKKFIAENSIQFDIPAGAQLNKRLGIVTHVLYLLFNEGYLSSKKEILIRHDLCEEAIRLTLLLTENNYTRKPGCFALLALMNLLASRFDARLDENGEIILLQDQDRSKWNINFINAGMDYLAKSAEGNELTEFHLQAAIVSEHTLAESFETTNWKRILDLYDLLMKINPSPVVLLNRAIVMSKLAPPSIDHSAIHAVLAIEGIEKLLTTNHLFAATLGELYKEAGNLKEAKRLLQSAVSLTGSLPEKKLLQKKLREMGES